MDLLHKQLRKSFRTIEGLKKTWNSSCETSLSYIQSLVNVAEQYHCVSRVAQSQSPDSVLVERYPDIQDRIQHKLVLEMELLAQKLHDMSKEMMSIHSKIHQQSINAMAVYKKVANNLPDLETTQGTPTWPSIADMLEWLHDLDCIFQFLHENQCQVLESLDYSNEELNQSLAARWKQGSKEAQESMDNVLAHVSLFMEDG